MSIATILFFNMVFLHFHTLFVKVHGLPDSIEEEGFRFFPYALSHCCFTSSSLPNQQPCTASLSGPKAQKLHGVRSGFLDGCGRTSNLRFRILQL